jgi:leucyl aminopeptidase (aminopeptidase T)
VKRLGSVGPAEVVCFPAGSLIACPESVSGTFVATASLGEFFGTREGVLRAPVTFEIAHGRVVRAACPGNDLLTKDIAEMLHVAPNSDRVGLLVLGINEGIVVPVGDAAVDQHRPGLHLVIGDPSPRLTGASWSARTSFAACQSTCTVKIDGEVVIDDGKLVVPARA